LSCKDVVLLQQPSDGDEVHCKEFEDLIHADFGKHGGVSYSRRIDEYERSHEDIIQFSEEELNISNILRWRYE